MGTKTGSELFNIKAAFIHHTDDLSYCVFLWFKLLSQHTKPSQKTFCVTDMEEH